VLSATRRSIAGDPRSRSTFRTESSIASRIGHTPSSELIRSKNSIEQGDASVTGGTDDLVMTQQRRIRTSDDLEEHSTSRDDERRQIDGAIAARMRPHVGSDVSHARVSSGPASDAAARSIGATAFTVGSEVVFRSNAYQPGTVWGDALLAHELTHVAQQSEATEAGAPGNSAVGAGAVGAGAVGAGVEHEADQRGVVAARRALGEPGPSSPRPTHSRRGLALKWCGGESTEKKAARLAVAPPTRTGSKKLSNGTMAWTLESLKQSSARMTITFDPAEGVASSASAVTFVQLVKDQSSMGTFGGGPAYRTSGGFAVDLVVDPSMQGFTDVDPFYGAQGDSGGNWAAEPGSSRPWLAKDTKPSAASLLDEPSFNIAQGDRKDFETVAVIPATGQVLGALTWGFEFPEDRPRQFHGATDSDCTEAASSRYREALDKYYIAHFSVTVDGFELDKSDLNPTQITQLDGAVPALTSQRAIVMGFSESGEKDAPIVATARAAAVAKHLKSKGITTEERSYGANWAKVPTAAGPSGTNRRVQVQAVKGASGGAAETKVQ
jgi:outer membrane protein OmpA-like peptidoglycan-associated protein